MLSLFLTHLQGYKRQAVRSPIFITLEVICELILPLIMAKIVDVAIPAGDTAYIFRLGGNHAGPLPVVHGLWSSIC